MMTITAYDIGEHARQLLSSNGHEPPDDENADAIKIGLTFRELNRLLLPSRDEIVCGLARCETGLLNAVTNIGKTTLIRNLALSLIRGVNSSRYIKEIKNGVSQSLTARTRSFFCDPILTRCWPDSRV